MSEFTFSILLGSGLICVYAADRFNSPSTTRASTTALRYYMAFTTYIVAYLCTYLILLHNPALLKQLLPDIDWVQQYGAGDDTLPVIMALGLSMLIPKAPVLVKLDRQLKKYLHRLASIPFEAHRLSKEIQSLEFAPPAGILAALQAELEAQAFSVRSLVQARTHPVLATWLKLTSLMLQLKHWERDEDFSLFVQERSGQFQRLQTRYKSLTAAAVSADELLRQAQEQPQVQSLQEAAGRFHRNLKAEEDALFSEMCDFISQALLANCYLNQRRCASLKQMGFLLPHYIPAGSVSIHQISWLLLVLSVLLTASFVLLGAQMTANFNILLLRVAMIVSIYCVAVYATVNLKAHWRWFHHRPGETYPAASYLLTGVIAMVSATVIMLGFNMLVEVATVSNAGLSAALATAWHEFTGYRYPWLVLTFLCAFTLSFLIDLDRSEWIAPRWRNAGNAVLLMLVQMTGSVLVYVWSQSLYADSGRELPVSLASVLRNSSIIGCVIGYWVPAWFNTRQAPGAPPAGTTAPVMAAATG